MILNVRHEYTLLSGGVTLVFQGKDKQPVGPGGDATEILVWNNRETKRGRPTLAMKLEISGEVISEAMSALKKAMDLVWSIDGQEIAELNATRDQIEQALWVELERFCGFEK